MRWHPMNLFMKDEFITDESPEISDLNDRGFGHSPWDFSHESADRIVLQSGVNMQTVFLYFLSHSPPWKQKVPMSFGVHHDSGQLFDIFCPWESKGSLLNKPPLPKKLRPLFWDYERAWLGGIDGVPLDLDGFSRILVSPNWTSKVSDFPHKVETRYSPRLVKLRQRQPLST